MGATTITFRIDENLKAKLQTLVNNLGMDITTFFTMSAKQAVMDQAIPFQPKMKGIYNNKAYQIAMQNTKYNAEGKAVVSADDEWIEETEWDDIYNQMKKERGII